MDITMGAALTIITLAALVIGAIVTLVKHFKPENQEWQTAVNLVRMDIENNKHKFLAKIADLENKITLQGLDAEKISEIKTWIVRIEQSIDTETTKLEDKIDKLLQLIIEMLGKK